MHDVYAREAAPSRTLLLVVAVVVALSPVSASRTIGGAHTALGVPTIARWALYALPLFSYLGITSYCVGRMADRRPGPATRTGDSDRLDNVKRALHWATAWLVVANTLGGYLRVPQAGVGAVILDVVSAAGAIVLLLLLARKPAARGRAADSTA
ncbi:hypothetical protein [Saccharothrix sp. Mg75]|uniref:hypothetical protein n=1 Tax=Saccharothrix sp. Mg75 TaxID=3445357 RepID=UPI003EEAE8B5